MGAEVNYNFEYESSSYEYEYGDEARATPLVMLPFDKTTAQNKIEKMSNATSLPFDGASAMRNLELYRS